MKEIFSAGLALAALWVFSPQVLPQTRSGGSAQKVKVEASAAKPDSAGNELVTVMLTVDKGWHIYANPARNKIVANNKTVLKVTSKGKLEVTRIDYPAGEAKVFQGQDMHVYDGTVAIRASVRRPTADRQPLDLELQVYACDKNYCLPRGTIKLSLP